MTKFQRAPELSEWRKSPMAVLFQRDVVRASVSVRNMIAGGDTGEFSVRSGRPISSGFRPEISVGCVSSVRVCVSVASLLRPVESAYGPVCHGPKAILVGVLQKLRRAAAAQKSTRLQQRFSELAADRLCRYGASEPGRQAGQQG